MAFLYVDDLDHSMPHVSQYGEVMMMRSFAGLNMELINNIMMADPISPNLLNHRVLELPVQGWMVGADHNKLMPVVVDLFVDLYL